MATITHVKRFVSKLLKTHFKHLIIPLEFMVELYHIIDNECVEEESNH
jgi:hypothetical protein